MASQNPKLLSPFGLPLPLPVQVGLLHILAWIVALGCVVLAPQIGIDLDRARLPLLQGLIAGALSYLSALPFWWLPINLIFFPLLAWAQQWELASTWYLVALLLLLSTQLGALRSRVPLYLSSRRAKSELLHLLPARQDLRFLDIGSGTGGLLAYLAKMRPDIALDGIESAPALWLYSRLRLSRRATVRLGDFWDKDLSSHDVVYAFLSPEPMARLWDKAKREMRPGSLFISNSFAIPDVAPDAAIELHDLNRGRLMLWRMR